MAKIPQARDWLAGDSLSGRLAEFSLVVAATVTALAPASTRVAAALAGAAAVLIALRLIFRRKGADHAELDGAWVSEPDVEPYLELTLEQRKEIEGTLLEWGGRADPREPQLLILGDFEITGGDIARAMKRRRGRVYAHVMNLFAVGARSEELGSILEDFAPGER